MPQSAPYKVVLLQLPYLYNFLNARNPSVTNVPLGCGYLKAYAHHVGLLADGGVDIEILDPLESDRAGHGRLVEHLIELQPDMVGFSIYEWNAHQSFDIARTLKKRLPGVVTVVGGPEIIPNSHEVHFYRHPELDVGVMGDGEITFVELIEHFRGRGKPLSQITGIVYRDDDGEVHANPMRDELVPYKEVPSPYLLGYLDPKMFGFMLLESERGCPFKCAYCNWSGSRRNVFDVERIKKELLLARDRGIEAVHFLDPTFNTSRNAKQILEFVKEFNTDRKMHFFANVYAELLKEPQIDDLAAANFTFLTAGLQSVNQVALNNINRKNNLPKFVDRIHKLVERGIFVYIDIILGLPGDGLDDVRKALDFIQTHGLVKYSRYNILTVNPDSALWGMKEKFGLKAQSQPPYRILQTNQMSFEEIREAIELCDDTLQFGQCYGFFEEPSMATHFLNGKGVHPDVALESDGDPLPPEFITRRDRPAYTKVILDVDATRDDPREMHELGRALRNDIGSHPVVWFRSADPQKDLKLMQAFFRAVTPDNPFSVWKIILESEALYSPRLIQRLESAIDFKINNIDYDLIYRAEKLKGEWVRHAQKTFPVLPIARKEEAAEIIIALGKDPQFLWNLGFRTPDDVDRLLALVPRGNVKEGLLVDFSPAFDEESVVSIVQRIIQRRGGFGRNMLFRNGLIQHAYDWRLKNTPFKLPERILTARGGTVRRIEEFDRNKNASRIGEWIEALILSEQRARRSASAASSMT